MLRRACRWRILPALLLGVATTTLIAWSSVFWPESMKSGALVLSAPGPIVTERGPDASFEVGAWRSAALDMCYSSSVDSFHNYTTLPRTMEATDIAPAQVLHLLWLEKGVDEKTRRAVSTRGWPLRSMCSVTTTCPGFDSAGRPTHVVTSRFGIVTPAGTRNPHYDSLPLLPLWWGFWADSAIFGAAWWVVLIIPGAARRTWRRRRGLCTRCAYDRQGLPPASPCPECGSAHQ